MKTALVRCAAGSMLALLTLASAVAQSDSSSIMGQVTSRISGTPVPLAVVEVMGGRAQALTDSGGRFRLAGLAAGTHVIRIRRVGFVPLEVEVDVARGEAMSIPGFLLRLDALAVRVDSVVVTAEGERFVPSLVGQGFYERRRIS